MLKGLLIYTEKIMITIGTRNSDLTENFAMDNKFFRIKFYIHTTYLTNLTEIVLLHHLTTWLIKREN